LIPGVEKTIVGYTGGKKSFPTYRKIGDHTEAVRLEFDPKRVSYSELLERVFKNVSPFRKALAYSKQYQHAVWWTNDEQRDYIQKKVKEVESKFGKQVLMEISEAKKFYRAEEYHQQYVAKGRY